ncbi:MAG TPA: amidohydrolase family protein [Gemmatimonadales bacterium]|nr:amidohydrolase family protein [Gemmatimonadales bacterium]
MAGKSSTTTRPVIERRARRRATVARAFARTLASALALVVAGCTQQAPTGTALVGATLLDGTGAAPRPDVVVVVRDGRVEAITPRARFKLPRRTREVDVSGKWILPGLIDAHAHVAPWALKRYLGYGVTTVRDMGGNLDAMLALRERVSRGGVDGPRIYAAGAMIDGRPSTYTDALPASTEGEARKAVDRLSVTGVDFIKVYTRVDEPILKGILDEAGTFRLHVAGHLGLVDAVTASRLGLYSIEHMSGIPEAAATDPSELMNAHYHGFWPGWTAFEQGWAGLDSAALAKVAGELAAKKTFIVPTLVLHETFSRLDDSVASQSPELRAVPAEVQTAWDVPGMIRRAEWGAASFAAFRRSRAKQNLFVREFQRAGGRLATGTDAANQLLIPGFSEHQELELLVQAGLTPAEALAAATRNGAQLLGADSLGQVAPGKVADLVVVAGNPLADIRNTRKVEQVMVRGKLLSADSIRASW